MFFQQISLFILVSLTKHYLDTYLDTSEKILDTLWILFGVPLDAWPPLHLATKLPDNLPGAFLNGGGPSRPGTIGVR